MTLKQNDYNVFVLKPWGKSISIWYDSRQRFILISERCIQSLIDLYFKTGCRFSKEGVPSSALHLLSLDVLYLHLAIHVCFSCESIFNNVQKDFDIYFRSFSFRIG